MQCRQHRVADQPFGERHDHNQIIAAQPALQAEEAGIGEGIQQVGHAVPFGVRRLAPTGRPPVDSIT